MNIWNELETSVFQYFNYIYFILKLVFPHCFCFDSHLSGCVVAIIAVVFSVVVIVFLIFVLMFIISAVSFIINVTITFAAVVVNTVAAIYACVFNLGVIVCVYFTVNSVEK